MVKVRMNGSLYCSVLRYRKCRFCGRSFPSTERYTNKEAEELGLIPTPEPLKDDKTPDEPPETDSDNPETRTEPDNPFLKFPTEQKPNQKPTGTSDNPYL